VQELIDIKAIVSFHNRLWSCVLITLLKYWVSHKQLTIITEMFELMKNCAESDLFFINIFDA